MTTLEALTPTVQAMHGEVQQLMQERTLLRTAMQRLTADLATTTATVNTLQAQQVQDTQIAVAATQAIRNSGDALTAQISDAVHRLTQLEQGGVGPSTSASVGKPKWELTRPKDMEPDQFVGKDEEWLRWKAATEDYVDAVHPGLKHVLGVAAKVTGQITDQSQLGGVLDEEWMQASKLFILLKRKTTGEARTLVMSAVRDNGFVENSREQIRTTGWNQANERNRRPYAPSEHAVQKHRRDRLDLARDGPEAEANCRHRRNSCGKRNASQRALDVHGSRHA